MRKLIFCLLAVACTSSNNTDHTKTCNDVAAARCAKLMSCSASDFSRRYASMSVCQMRLAQPCLNNFAAPQSSATDTGTETCAAALPSQDCAEFLAGITPPACYPSPGARAAGMGCAFSGQCATAFCNFPEGAACGTCAPEPKAGDPCGDCGSRGLVCFNGACTQPVAVGANCDRAVTPCTAGSQCVAPAMAMGMGMCVAEPTTAGATCDARRHTGADCSRDAALYCNATNMCTATTMAADNAPCGNLAGVVTQCATGGCFGAVGMTPGACKAFAADGAACDTIAGPSCQPPARCVGMGVDGGSTGTCQIQGSTSC
jgi:hypothetical protein